MIDFSEWYIPYVKQVFRGLNVFPCMPYRHLQHSWLLPAHQIWDSALAVAAGTPVPGARSD